jgi:SAM-dependent methyltransferase
MGSLASAVPFTPAEAAAQQTTTTNGHHPDVTFKNFNAAQAQNYRTARSTYPPALFDYILAFHTTTPIIGDGDRALDVGCGPGNVTVDLAQRFDHVMGVDHSAGMVETANKAGIATRAGEKVEFRVCGAEDIDKLEGIAPGSVDLITSGTAVSVCPYLWMERR